jgi:hypothetical protein
MKTYMVKFLFVTSIGRNPKPPSQIDRCLCGEMEVQRARVSPPPRPTPGAGTFQVRCGSFRDLVFVSFFRCVVILGVTESTSQRPLMGRNGMSQTD